MDIFPEQYDRQLGQGYHYFTVLKTEQHEQVDIVVGGMNIERMC